ncbi:MAG TPA: tetratricopeptide repeat protein, partial [Steroidobacteraceae bacterium]|nr:tetratricopeptide repeat protein [Steroidobacteraceae bacterium]
MNASSEPVGSLATALAHTQRLMTSEPQLAAEQATEILKVAPGHPLATLLLGVALRRSGDAATSQAVLEPLAQSQPNWAAAHYELGLTRGARRDGDGAVAALRRAVSLKPEMPDAWRALGDHLTAMGDASGADDAYAQHIKFSTHDPRLMEA